MSDESGAYRITNRMIPLVLSLSVDDQRSVIAEGGGPPDNQTWIIRYVGEGKVQIRSKANGMFLGFPGMPIPGARLIVGDEDIAKVWEVIADEPDFKFGLPNTPLVIQFPPNNLRPGTPAQLGLTLPDAPNQVWTLKKLD